MLVSIIIPNFNSELYLTECLDSCVSQLDAENLEIIVVDDHSTDSSTALLATYRLKYPNLIKSFINPKKGACSARNYGFEQSKGDFIQFLDSDDMLSENKIKHQLEVIKKKDNAVANCGWIHFSKESKVKDYNVQKVDKSYSDSIEYLKDCWNGGGMWQTGCWLIPKNLVKMVGGWNESLLRNQDGEFMCRVLSEAQGIEFVNDNFVFYRKPIQFNVSQRSSFEAMESLLDSLKLYENVLEYRDSQDIKSSLCRNYNRFIYRNFNKFPDLGKQASSYIASLGCGVDIPFIDKKLRLVNKLFGYRCAFMIRRIVKGY